MEKNAAFVELFVEAVVEDDPPLLIFYSIRKCRTYIKFISFNSKGKYMLKIYTNSSCYLCIQTYLVGSKPVEGGVVGCRGKTIPGDANRPGPPGLSPFVTWDKSIVN